jgi:hypothetical protein
MKSVTAIIIVLLLAVVAPAEYPENPDRFTSLTFMGGIDAGSGDHKITDFNGSVYEQDLKPSGFGLGATLVAPMSNNVSFIARCSYSGSETSAERNNDFSYDSESKYSVFSIDVGFRIYIK